MRKLLIALVVLALAVPLARGAGGLGVFGSYWDMKDADDAALGGGIKFKMEMAPPICLELRASYLQEFAEEPLEDANIVPLEAALVIDFPLVKDMLTVYGGGGVGYYIMPEFEASEALGPSGEPDIDPDDELGFFAAAGVELQLSEQVALFGEVKYTWLEVDELEVDEEEVDLEAFDAELKLDGVGFNAGLLFKW